LGNQIHAQVALLHLSFGAKLGHAKRAHHQAEMTAETLFLVHHYDPIFGSLPDGAPWTYGFTRGITAVQTGKGNAPVRDHRKWAFPDRQDSSPFDAPFDLVQGLAGHLAGVALDASVRIEIEAVLFCHYRYLV
jgi:hypothetical protein